MSQITLDSFGGYQKARQLFDLVAADMETLKTNWRLHRRDAEDAEERAFDKHYSELCGLCASVVNTSSVDSAESNTFASLISPEDLRAKLADVTNV